MAEIHVILGVAFAAINLGNNCQHNKRKSNRLIKCLQAVTAPLESIDRAEHDRIQVSHEETLSRLKDVIERAHALLDEQTKDQNPVLKALRSSNVRDQFHEIQIDLQAHLQTLTLSVGVLSGVQIQKMQVGLDVVKEVNREALEEHLDKLCINQGIMKGNQRNILENQNTTHDNQRNMLSKAEVALRNQDEMKSMLAAIVQNQLNVSGNVGNTYITNDHSTTTTNNINNVTNNYHDQRSNVSDSDYSRTTKPRKPEPYVKRKTKLHIAAEKGSFSEVKVALRECFIDHETPTGSTSLLLAVENNHVEVVKELLLVGVDFTVEANKKAWMHVMEKKDVQLIPHFADGGVDVNGKYWEYGATPLHWSAEKGHLDVVRALIEAGADVNPKMIGDRTPLFLSAEEGHLEVARALVEAGADVNAKQYNKGWTPLHMSAEMGHLEVVRALIEAGADVNAKEDDGGTPLHRSASYGELEVARALIEAGADVNAKRDDGWTPLHWSAGNGQLEVAQALIEAGADVNAKKDDGMTPLHLSAQEGRLEIARALIEAGADVNAKANDGRTPLHWSARDGLGFGHLGVARALIEAGADVNAKEKHGRTPLQCSREEGSGHVSPWHSEHLEVARALINAGSTFDGLSSEQVADLLRKISGLAAK